jgi:hypothetical protein
MAKYIAVQDGNFSTAATWNRITNTPTIHATTNTTISTSNLYTATFTAPNLINSCTGMALHVVQVGTGSLTVTLQEYTGAVWNDTTATITVNIANLTIYNWNYLSFALPYTFTTTNAGYYRFRIIGAALVGTTRVAADSGGTLLSFLASDNRTAVPGLNDDALVVNTNLTGTRTITLNGTQSFGSGVVVTYNTGTESVVTRTFDAGLMVGVGGLIVADTSANVNVTLKGSLFVSRSGEFRVGTSGSAYPSNRTFTFNFDENGTSCNYGIWLAPSAKWTIYGTPKSSTVLWKTTYSSGLGTAASPLITAGNVDWVVGDEIILAPTSNNATNYNESETRFIITKNAANSYVLSSTKGGAETALVYSHTGGLVVNIERNILFSTTNSSFNFALLNCNTTAGQINSFWARYTNVGTSVISYLNAIYVEFTTNCQASWDYNVCTNSKYLGFAWRLGRTEETFNGNISVNSADITVTGAAFYFGAATKKTLNDFVAIKNDRAAFMMENSNSIIVNNAQMMANNIDNSSVGNIYLVNAYNITWNSCEVHCNRYAISFWGAISTFNNLLLGTKGNNSNNIYTADSYYTKILFSNISFSGSTLVLNYLLMADTSEVKFDKYNGIENNHFWYTNKGIMSSTGAGLSDTTVKTAGTLNLRFAPEDSTDGATHEFLVLAKANSAVSCYGFIRRNATFNVGDITVELFLPGSLTADNSYTLPTTTDSWLFWQVGANYSSSISRYATVRITAKTATAGAYCYLADIFNGTNNITNLLTWYQGQPSPIMFEQLGDAAAVWAVLKSASVVSGTMGKAQGDIDTLTKLIPASL